MFSSKFNIGVLKHPGYNVGGGIGEAALIGAAFGGAKSLATGEDVLEGALLGGITGGAMGGIGNAVFGSTAGAATGTVAKDATGRVLASSVPGTTGVGAFTNVADDVALTVNQASQAANQGITGLSGVNAGMGPGGLPEIGMNANRALTATGAQGNIGQLSNLDLNAAIAPNFNPTVAANAGQAGVSSGLSSSVPSALSTQAPQGVAALTPPVDRNPFEMVRDYAGAKPGSTTAKALNFAADNPVITSAGLGFGMGALEPRKLPKMKPEEKSKLHGYDPDNFTAYVPEQPNPYYSAQYAAEGGTMRSYAQGGITALAQGGMGGNMGYPQGRLDSTQYATPTQMPTSAQVVNADYEQATNPYMGSPLKMAEGGVASYAFGGSANDYGANAYGVPYFSGARNLSELSEATQSYNRGRGDMGGKFGGNIQSANGTIGDNFQPFEATPEVYQQAYQTQQAPMAEYNPNTAAVAAQAVASPSYDAMMQGVAPQDFNRVFSQVMNQNSAPQAPQEEKQMASGGIAGFNLGGYAAGGNPRLLKGPGDGMSDNIPAMIGNRQPARLADGEFVVPADVVSHLGNGSTDAGAKHLYAMMDKVRTARTGRKAQGKQIKPEKYLPR